MKYEIFKMFYDANNNPEKYSNWFRNELLNIIVHYDWLEEYNRKYPNEFGL